MTIAASAGFFVEVGYGLLDRAILGAPEVVMARFAHALACLAMVALLLARRTRPVSALTYTAYAVTFLPLVPIFWVVEARIAQTSMPWTPFVGYKFILIPLALLTPAPLWVAVVTVLVFCAEAFVQSQLLRFSEHPVLTAGEPWPTLLFGLVALVIVAQRARSQVVAVTAERALAERATFAWLATLFMALRDGSNTPLQTLSVGLEVLRRRHPDDVDLIAPMERSIARLEEINRTVAACDAQIPKGSVDASFDAREQLARFEQMLRNRT